MAQQQHGRRHRAAGNGEHQGAVVVEPQPGAEDDLGEQRQVVALVQQIGKPRHDEDEDEHHRGQASHDQDGRIGERAPEIGGHFVVVFELRDGLAQGFRQAAAELAGFHELQDVVRQRQIAGAQGRQEVLAPAKPGGHVGKGLRQGGMAAAAALGQHRIAQGDARLQQGRQLMQGDHDFLGAQPPPQKAG